MKTKFIYVILAALLIGSQTISAQNKDNKTNKQRPTPEQMIQRQANQMVTTLMLDDATAAKFTPVYEKYLKVIKNPSILHYAVDMKPWDCPEHSTAEIFWHYAQKTPFFARIIYKHFEQKIYALSRQKPEKAAVRAAEVQKIPLI